MLKRAIKELLFRSICFLFVVLTGIVLISILYSLVSRGLWGLNLDFFSLSAPTPGGQGGLAHAILGSFIINLLAIFISVTLGLCVASYLSEYSMQSKFSKLVLFMNEIVMSVPSILVGLFIYVLIVQRFRVYSGFAGALALSLIALPIITKVSYEMLTLVPKTLRESSAALGIPKWKTTYFIVWKAARPGLITGALLGLARVSGETAPLLFTALNNHFMSFDILAPMANLPVTVYQFATSPYENWQNLAWSGALFITLTLLFLNILIKKFFQRKNFS